MGEEGRTGRVERRHEPGRWQRKAAAKLTHVGGGQTPPKGCPRHGWWQDRRLDEGERRGKLRAERSRKESEARGWGEARPGGEARGRQVTAAWTDARAADSRLGRRAVAQEGQQHR